MEFRVLGSLEVVDHNGLLALGAPQQRALLAMLLVHRGEMVFSERLTDELWGDQPPSLDAPPRSALREMTRRPAHGHETARHRPVAALAARDSIHVRRSTHSAWVQ